MGSHTRQLTSAALLAIVAAACEAGRSPAVEPCVVTVTRAQIAVTSIDRIDILLVIDDSPSMAEEQALLQRALPRMMGILSGVEGQMNHPPDDLHIAVVPASAGAEAGAATPDFVRYRGAAYLAEQDDPDEFATELTRRSVLGAEGAEPSQPLESALATLTAPGASDFLRSDPARGLSLVAVVIITDGDDCSLAEPHPDAAPNSVACLAAGVQPLERYLDGLRGLRPGNENLVELAVIAGVPPELTDEPARAGVDFSDIAAREAYYSAILADPAMAAEPDPAAPSRLRPACATAEASAEPARRLTELVRGFGEYSQLASICDPDFPFAIERLFEPLVSSSLGEVCLPQVPPRNAEGLWPCRVYWELPPADAGIDLAPSRCEERPFLRPAPGLKPTLEDRVMCEVAQLRIAGDDDLLELEPGGIGHWGEQGFYIDDFSRRAQAGCVGDVRQRLAFTEFARPPSGVLVHLACQELETTGGARDADACLAPGNWPRYTRGVRLPEPETAVGAACAPIAEPDQGFDERQIRLELGHPRCETGVCIVDQLRGSTAPDCEDWPPPDTGVLQCADADEIRERVYCSCRCAAPDPADLACRCPRGFVCREVTTADAAPSFAGSYCVRDHGR